MVIDGLRGPRSRGYLPYEVNGRPRISDVTEFDPSKSDANGDGISTLPDLQRIYRALLGGRLVPRR